MNASPLALTTSSTSIEVKKEEKVVKKVKTLRPFALIAAVMCFFQQTTVSLSASKTISYPDAVRMFKNYLQETNPAHLRASIQHNINEFNRRLDAKKVVKHRVWGAFMLMLRVHDPDHYDVDFWNRVVSYYNKGYYPKEQQDITNMGLWSRVAHACTIDLLPIVNNKSPLQRQMNYAAGMPSFPVRKVAKKAAKRLVGKAK